MKKTVVTGLVLALLFTAAPLMAGQNAPESVAGFTIGKNISSVRSLLQMDSQASPWQEEYLKRIAIRELEGYRGGYLVIGNCKRKDIILRMKLKYDDSSMDFFNQLYSKIEKDSVSLMIGEETRSGLSKSGNGLSKTTTAISALFCSTSAEMMIPSPKATPSDFQGLHGLKRKGCAGKRHTLTLKKRTYRQKWTA